MIETTFTQVFNAHGGLLTLRMKLFVDQEFILKNSKTASAASAAWSERNPPTTHSWSPFSSPHPRPTSGPSPSRPKIGKRSNAKPRRTCSHYRLNIPV